MVRRALDPSQRDPLITGRWHNHSAIPSPVQRLPIEILSLIFLHSVYFPDHELEVSNADWPWAIERVCKTWRNIILAYPRVWSFITIHTSPQTFGIQAPSVTHRSTILQLKSQLSRSRQSPLSVLLSDRGAMSPELVKVLVQCASRIQDLHINMGNNVARDLSSLKDRFDTLSSLYVIRIPNAFSQGDTPLLDLGRCPNLRYLETHGVSRRPKLLLPWHLIHNYHSFMGKFDRHEGLTTGESLVDLLTAAPQLRGVSFSLQSRNRNSTPYVHCNHLQSLSLEHAATYMLPSFREFFECVTFPCLTHLEIHRHEIALWETLGGDVFTAMIDAIVRSSCPLLHLSYTQGYVLSDDVIRLIHTAPTLSSMKLQNVVCPGVANILSHAFKDLNLAPRLHDLLLHGSMQFDGKVYVDVVFHERYTKACPFKDLKLTWVPSVPVALNNAEAQLDIVCDGLKEHSSLFTFTGNLFRF